MGQIYSLKTNKLTWHNIINAGDAEIVFLRKNYHFNELDLADAYAKRHAQRPKIDIRENYLFLVFLFPFYNHTLKIIEPKEIDIFITTDTIITIQNLKNGEVNSEFDRYWKDKILTKSLAEKKPLVLLYELLDKLYTACFPMIDHISLDINHIEHNIYAKKERQIVEDVLIIKRNIVNFLKIMQPHKRILRKIATTDFPFLTGEKKLVIYYNDLIDATKNIWDTVDNYRQTVDNLEDTNNILVSFKINDVMRTLTIVSVIVFPLTLIAGIFGMNVIDMPIVGQKLDFWKIILLMAAASIGMFSYFKYKKWI